jgi:hypothetical protein
MQGKRTFNERQKREHSEMMKRQWEGNLARRESVAKSNRLRKSKSVACYDYDTNALIAQYDSIALAAQGQGVSAASVSHALRGVSATCKGYIWRYV